MPYVPIHNINCITILSYMITIRQATSLMINQITFQMCCKENRNVKHKEIAQLLGISNVTLSRLYTGVQNPDVQTFVDILKLYKSHVSSRKFMEFINKVI